MFLIKFLSASVFERASFVWSASVGEREDLFVIVYSPLCFPPRVERVLILITFTAAPSSNLVIAESAQDFHSPLFLLCLEILNLFIKK